MRGSEVVAVDAERLTTRILLVRAVNVGGHAKLPMADFRHMLEDLGCKHARTYIASGNAVVELPETWAAAEWAKFDRAVEQELEARFGFRRRIISRGVSEMQDALASHPFDITDPKKSLITFLEARPRNENIAHAAEVPTGDDEWLLRGADLHVKFANGMGAATLNLDALLKRIGATGTARNLRTVEAILALARN